MEKTQDYAKAIKNVEVKMIKSFKIILDPQFTNGHDYCELIIDESNNEFIAKLYGEEIYSYKWNSPGEDFLSFLINVFSNENELYLFHKIADTKYNNLIDIEKTIRNMKKLVMEARYNLNLDENEARDLWDEIESFEGNEGLSSNYFYDLYQSSFKIGIKNDVFSDEPCFEESIEYMEDWQCRIFCNKVAPILAEVIKNIKTSN